MTKFKVGDRVKVVRESVDRPGYNCSLLPDIGNSGKIFDKSTVPNVWFVEIDNGDGYYFPADMLELEKPTNFCSTFDILEDMAARRELEVGE